MADAALDLAGQQSRRRLFALLVLSLGVVVLNVIRCPELLLTPRFYAEEGANYFAGAYQRSFASHIFSANFGYYTLYNQLATALAARAPLEWAPLVTIWLALGVQVGISLFALWGDIPPLRRVWQRGALALAIPLLIWPEYWLTSIGMHCWFATGVFLVLIGPALTSGRSASYGRLGYLAFAGLSGVISCFMIPAFSLRAWRERSRFHARAAAVLLGCLLVHGGVFLYTLLNRAGELTSRFTPNPLSSLLTKWVIYQFAVPFAGRGIFESGASRWFGALVAGMFQRVSQLNDFFYSPLVFGSFAMIVAAGVIILNRRRTDVQVITLAFLTVCTFSVVFSVNFSGGPRYYFLPSLMLLTLLLMSVDLALPRVLTAGALFLVVTSLAANGLEFRQILRQRAYNPDYPSWKTEVTIWRVFPDHELKIWPPDWRMTLHKREPAN